MKAKFIEPKKEVDSKTLPAFYTSKSGEVVLFFTDVRGAELKGGVVLEESNTWGCCMNRGIWTRMPKGTTFELIQD